MAARKKSSKKASGSSKLTPLFAKLLETHFPKNTSSNQQNDVIETKKYPNDNADLSHVPQNVQVLDMKATSKNSDTIWITLKYPSDTDEYVTLKYPSDSDEDFASMKDYQSARASATNSQNRDFYVTMKYPSDDDDFYSYLYIFVISIC